MIGVFGKDKRNIHQGTQGKAPLEFQHLGEKNVSMFFFFFLSNFSISIDSKES